MNAKDVSTVLGVWSELKATDGGIIFRCIYGKNVQITLEPRPHYCDRGNWIAKVHPWGDKSEQIRACYIDGADGWPRYYFSEERAKAEIEAWLKKREQI